LVTLKSGAQVPVLNTSANMKILGW